MPPVSGAACELKHGVLFLRRRCGAPSLACCQYCGRLFCRDHGIVQDDGQEICARKECVAKREDLVKHLAYKHAALARNEQKQCGIEGCRLPLAGECSRCKAFFCGRHVGRQEEIVLQGRVRVRQMATLCDHCAARREIWLRT